MVNQKLRREEKQDNSCGCFQFELPERQVRWLLDFLTLDARELGFRRSHIGQCWRLIEVVWSHKCDAASEESLPHPISQQAGLWRLSFLTKLSHPALAFLLDFSFGPRCDDLTPLHQHSTS